MTKHDRDFWISLSLSLTMLTLAIYLIITGA